MKWEDDQGTRCRFNMGKFDLRNAQVSEAVRRMNPELFGGAPTAKPEVVKVAPRSVQDLGELKNEGPKYRSKLEREYHAVLKAEGYAYCEHEPLRLKLAKRSNYTPDFVTRDAAGNIVCWETKGFWREAARVRIKVAARLFPWMTFIAVKKRKAADGGGYEKEVIYGE